MSRLELTIRTLAIVLAAVVPFVCIATEGVLTSYSWCWDTPMQPYFILANMITAYYFYDSSRWKLPGILLLLLTVFSVSDFGTLHNLLSTVFFLSCYITIKTSNHFNWLSYVFLASMLLLAYNIMIAEIFAILILALYHGLILYKIQRIQKQKPIQL